MSNKTVQLPDENDLPEWTTKDELAAQIYPDTQYDTALPQPWVDHCQAKGFDPRGTVVWGYPTGYAMGKPMPLTMQAARKLQELMLAAG